MGRKACACGHARIFCPNGVGCRAILVRRAGHDESRRSNIQCPRDYGSPIGAKFKTPQGRAKWPGSLWQWCIMFLPHFTGYDKENWFDDFSREKIVISTYQFRPANEMRKGTKAVLKSLQQLGVIAKEPSDAVAGLLGYQYADKCWGYWVGERDNGEMFGMESRHPNETGFPEPNPLCDVRIFEERSRLDM